MVAIETCPVCGGHMPRGERNRLSVTSELLDPPWGGYIGWGESSSTLICNKCMLSVEMLLQEIRRGRIEPDTTAGMTTDTTKSQTISLSSSLCEHGVSAGISKAAPNYSEVTPKCDREALLALADEMQGYADGAASAEGFPYVNAGYLWAHADRIREACGVAVDV